MSKKKNGTKAMNSDERIEDVCFENLIRRWGEQREFEWVTAAHAMYGHILEERDRLKQMRKEAARRESEVLKGVVVDPDDQPMDLEFAEDDEQVNEQFEEQLTTAVEEEPQDETAQTQSTEA